MSLLVSCAVAELTIVGSWYVSHRSPVGGKETDGAVDGTSGFIRHQQFAVCLALIVDGQVELGVIGCPNLGPESAKIGEEVIPNGKGVLMVAVKGEGSYSVRPHQEGGFKWKGKELADMDSDHLIPTSTLSLTYHLHHLLPTRLHSLNRSRRVIRHMGSKLELGRSSVLSDLV